jgi:hypothetical protein
MTQTQTYGLAYTLRHLDEDTAKDGRIYRLSVESTVDFRSLRVAHMTEAEVLAFIPMAAEAKASRQLTSTERATILGMMVIRIREQLTGKASEVIL